MNINYQVVKQNVNLFFREHAKTNQPKQTEVCEISKQNETSPTIMKHTETVFTKLKKKKTCY